MKKIISITIAILLIGGFWFVSFNKPKSKSNVEEITFTSWGSKSEIDILLPLLDEFEWKNQDIRVKFMHIPQNYFQKLHLLFASNTAPDVIFINNQYLPLYAKFLEPAETDGEFYPKVLQSMIVDGTIYAVPRDVSNLVIFYNKDIFKSKNIPYPTKDWTFNDFLKTAQELTGNGVWGISFDESPLLYLPYLMSEGGGFLSDDLTHLIIETPKSQKGLLFYANLRKKYHVAPLKEESASATMAQMFLQGKLAMQISGRWLVPKYRQDAEFDWDVINFPNGDAGSVVPIDSSGWAIVKSSKHKEASKRLVKFLSSKHAIEKFTESGLIVPARRDVAESPAFLDGKKPKNAKIFTDIIETGKPTPVTKNYREILDNLKQQNEKVFN